MRIYVASSWRTTRHPEVVQALREAGHDVYDYREKGRNHVDLGLERDYSLVELRDLLTGHEVEDILDRDLHNLEEADALVLVLPSGRSAHWEAGSASGFGIVTCLLWEPCEPEFIYGTFDIVANDIQDIIEHLSEYSDAC